MNTQRSSIPVVFGKDPHPSWNKKNLMICAQQDNFRILDIREGKPIPQVLAITYCLGAGQN